GFHDGKSLAIFLRDASGSIAAGLYGWTWAGCLKVNDLWVREDERRRGRGSELLEAAENEALRAAACEPFSIPIAFRAPDFYQRRGYSVVGVVEDFPPGHRTYTLFKTL